MIENLAIILGLEASLIYWHFGDHLKRVLCIIGIESGKKKIKPRVQKDVSRILSSWTLNFWTFANMISILMPFKSLLKLSSFSNGLLNAKTNDWFSILMLLDLFYNFDTI